MEAGKEEGNSRQEKRLGEGGEDGRPGKKGRRWQRHTLPHRYQCSTICAHELNCRVRNGTGCTLTALATNSLTTFFRWLPAPSHPSTSLVVHGDWVVLSEAGSHTLCVASAALLHFFIEYKFVRSHFASPEYRLPRITRYKSPRPLVPLGYRHCCPSTCGLSNWWSASGLTLFKRWGISS